MPCDRSFRTRDSQEECEVSRYRPIGWCVPDCRNIRICSVKRWGYQERAPWHSAIAKEPRAQMEREGLDNRVHLVDLGHQVQGVDPQPIGLMQPD